MKIPRTVHFRETHFLRGVSDLFRNFSSLNFYSALLAGVPFLVLLICATPMWLVMDFIVALSVVFTGKAR